MRSRDLSHPPTLSIRQVKRQQLADVRVVCRRQRVQAVDRRYAALPLDVGQTSLGHTQSRITTCAGKLASQLLDIGQRETCPLPELAEACSGPSISKRHHAYGITEHRFFAWRIATACAPVDSPGLADKVGRAFSLNFGLGRDLRRPVGVNKKPRCAVAVKSLMSVFEIAMKRKELLLAGQNCSQIEFHDYP